MELSFLAYQSGPVGESSTVFPLLKRVGKIVRVLVVGSLLICSANAMAQRARPKSNISPGSKPAPTVQSSDEQQGFAALSAQATAAREGDKVDEAIALYVKALALKRDWAEGWWFLGTLYYDRNNYSEAASAFRQTAQLQGKAGAPWAMLGLCEFRLARYDDAAAHIRQGRDLGVGENQELERVMRYHWGLLYLVKGDFERSQQALGKLSFEGVTSEELIIALGLAVLRMGMLPQEVDINYRDRAVVRRAGLAEHFLASSNVSDATREYELLAKDFPKFPNVQYAYGRFLIATRDNDGAVAAFQRELQNSPKHALARMQIAYVKLLNKEAGEGIPLAEEAINLHPRLPLGHYILGRLLFDSGQIPRSIQELETARSLRPDEPKVYFALARAYSKANRKADAEQARETFTRLNQQAEAAEGRGDVRGETLPNDSTNTEKP